MCIWLTFEQAFDILDQEATEDEEMRQAYSAEVWTRPASHEANNELVEQANRYREILERAMHTDRETSEEWDQWSDKIAILCWDEVGVSG
ncbi:MAG TPA: hypothetical protein VGO47_02015 [Chlamydiales bacterium]|nr:hypothetical protein [Chlamydiales bacterium]